MSHTSLHQEAEGSIREDQGVYLGGLRVCIRNYNLYQQAERLVLDVEKSALKARKLCSR